MGGIRVGIDFDDEQVVCSKCGETKLVQIRLGDFHHYTDCDAGEDECHLIKDVIEANAGTDMDISVSKLD